MPKIDNEDKMLGYQGSDVPDEYIVEIQDIRPTTYVEEGSGVYETSEYKFKKRVIIRGLLQDNIDIKTTAQWSPLSAASFTSKMATEITQLISGRALITKWGSRQVWMGTSPLDFTINLRFEAVNDSNSEVLEPCRELQRMILPYTTGKHGDKFLLLPPGPLITGKTLGEVIGASAKGEIISVRIGKLLKMNRVVIRDINITFMNRFEEGGNPVSANAAIHFQTFEVLTKNSLEKELYHTTKSIPAKSQESVGLTETWKRGAKSIISDISEFAGGG